MSNDKWIPIGKYPKQPCLLCFESGHMVVGYYHEIYDEWRLHTMDGFETDMNEYDMEDGIPIAWQPLPERYKKGK